MSSVERSPAQVPANKLYVNTAAIQSSIFDGVGVSDSNKASWVPAIGALSTAGAVVLRDMGKSAFLPSLNGAFQSTVMRKIQLVPSGSAGFYGTGGTAGAEGTEFYTGYISIGGQSYGGGNGVPAAVARLN